MFIKCILNNDTCHYAVVYNAVVLDPGIEMDLTALFLTVYSSDFITPLWPGGLTELFVITP